MVNLLTLICSTFFIFLKIYQNMTTTNSATTVSTTKKLRNLFPLASNPEKIFFSLCFHVTALFENSELIINWITNQHQLKSLLGRIKKIIFNFLMIFGC